MASRSAKTLRYAQPPMAKKQVRPMVSAVRGVIDRNPKPSASFRPLVSAVMKRKKLTPRAITNDPRDVSGNRLGPRREVSEADRATRRSMLDAALKPGPQVARSGPKLTQTSRAVPSTPNPGAGVGGLARGRKIDELADQAQRGRRY